MLKTLTSRTCLLLNASNCRVSRAARSAALAMWTSFSCRASSCSPSWRSMLEYPENCRKEIVEVVGYSSRQSAYGLHLGSLLDLSFESLVFRHITENAANPAGRPFESFIRAIEAESCLLVPSFLKTARSNVELEMPVL